MPNLAQVLADPAMPVDQLGPETRKLRSRLAEAMIKQGVDTSPVGHWTQGAARLAQALVGGYELNRLESDDKALGGQLAEALLGKPPAQVASLPPTTRTDARPVSGPSAFDPGDIEMQAGLRTPVAYQPEVLESAKTSGINPMLLANVLKRESDFNPNAVGPVTRTGERALGMAQLMPGTAKELNADPMNPASAIPAAAQYLAQNQQRFGTEPLAAAAYNYGPGNVQKVGGDIARMPAETRNYVANVTPQDQLPPGATPAQQPGPPQAPGVAAPQLDPQSAQQIRALLANPATRAYGLQLYQTMITRLQPNYGFQTLPDGTIIRTDPRRGSIEPVYQGPKLPTYGVIGEEFGDKKYGWIDPTKRTTTPADAPPAQAPAPSPFAPPPSPGPAPGMATDPRAPAQLPVQPQTEPKYFPSVHKDVMALRKEVMDAPAYKNMAQAAPVYRSMLDAAGRDTRAADVNLIYGLAKIMDPTSVVRESEMTVAQAVATLPQYLSANVMSQLDATGRLDPKVRAAIMEEAHSRVRAYEQLYQQDATMYRGIAGRGRMREEDVIPNFGEFKPYQAAQPPGPIDQWQDLGHGVKIRRKQ